MAAEAARVLDYTGSDYYGTAAPARAPYYEPEREPEDIAVPGGRSSTREKAKEIAGQSFRQVSILAVIGAIFVGALMVFVVLAQVSYNEIANETARLNSQLKALSEQERRLEIKFESAIDMQEVERYAKDSLGMSKPDAEQVAVIRTIPVDSAEIIISGDDESSNTLSGFGSFISSLTEYFK